VRELSDKQKVKKRQQDGKRGRVILRRRKEAAEKGLISCDTHIYIIDILAEDNNRRQRLVRPSRIAIGKIRCRIIEVRILDVTDPANRFHYY
jgi:hypothetical protein